MKLRYPFVQSLRHPGRNTPLVAFQTHFSVLSKMSTSASSSTQSSVVLPGGLRIACQAWGRHDAQLKILAFHGWMDNSSTWMPIAPRLADLGAYVLAADLPGHGHSAHRESAAYYNGMDYAANSLELLRELRWEGAVLLGHSLGAGLSCIIAAAAPELVAAVMLVDGLGPYPQPIEQTVSVFRRAVDAKGGHLRAPRSIYPSIDAAAAHRVAAVGRNPGKQWISPQGARWLVERALEPASAAEVAAAAKTVSESMDGSGSAGEATPVAAVTDAGVSGGAGRNCRARDVEGIAAVTSTVIPAAGTGDGSAATSSDDGSVPVGAHGSGGWCFRHDPKIKGPAPHYLSEEQARTFLSAMRAPVLHVAAVDGWPRPPGVTEARALLVPDLEAVTLPGSHHLHLDPETAPAVFDAMASFLKRRLPHLLPS